MALFYVCPNCEGGGCSSCLSETRANTRERTIPDERAEHRYQFGQSHFTQESAFAELAQFFASRDVTEGDRPQVEYESDRKRWIITLFSGS